VKVPITSVMKKAGLYHGALWEVAFGNLVQRTRRSKALGALLPSLRCDTTARQWERDVDVSFVTESKVPTWDPLIDPGPIKKGDSRSSGKPYGNDYFTGPEQKVTENTKGDDSRVIMDRALPFIRNSVKKEKPFFAVIWFHTPHSPVGGRTKIS
jgi:hypothetical protein